MTVNDEKSLVDVTEKFFDMPVNLNNAVLRVAESLKGRIDYREFVRAIAQNEGYPVWNKAYITLANSANSGYQAITQRTTGSTVDTLVYIPLVMGNGNHVNAFIKADVSDADTVNIRLYRQSDYLRYPAEGVTLTGTTSAESYALRFMQMDKEVFGFTRFKITDKRLFRGGSGTRDFIDTTKTTVQIQFDTAGNSGSKSDGVTVNKASLQTLCVTIINTTSVNHCPYSPNQCPNRYNNGIPGPCDNCPETCATVSLSTFEQCESWLGGGSSGGGGGWPGAPPAGSGGGSGGGIGGSNPPPCPTPFPVVLSALKAPIENTCTPVPNPWPPVPEKDIHGYYFSKIAELNALFIQNPFLLTPCDSLSLMPFENYGPMYQRIAQYKAPANVVNRIDSIRSVLGGWIVDNFNFQTLSEAYGPVVNCDYFPAQITQFPVNNLTGLQMTPAEFLEFFRLNINSFITPPIAVNFSPVFGPQFDDYAKWNQFSGFSQGALVHIYIPGPAAGPIGTSNSGSVILSDYQHINNLTSEQHYFKFSTLETPFDYEHPVAGNREFGIFNTSNNPSHYTFYTMGVDRVWDWLTDLTANYGFRKADELWTNVQQNIITYINNNGGAASNYMLPKIVARPKWNDVKEFLLGNITMSQLKTLLGC